MNVSVDRARADSAAINARLAGLLRAATVEVYEKNSPKVLDSFFSAGADVYVSYLPGDDFRTRIEIAKILRGAGYNPILHIPARQMMTRQMLSAVSSGCTAHFTNGGAPCRAKSCTLPLAANISLRRQECESP